MVMLISFTVFALTGLFIISAWIIKLYAFSNIVQFPNILTIIPGGDKHVSNTFIDSKGYIHDNVVSIISYKQNDKATQNIFNEAMLKYMTFHRLHIRYFNLTNILIQPYFLITINPSDNMKYFTDIANIPDNMCPNLKQLMIDDINNNDNTNKQIFVKVTVSNTITNNIKFLKFGRYKLGRDLIHHHLDPKTLRITMIGPYSELICVMWIKNDKDIPVKITRKLIVISPPSTT